MSYHVSTGVIVPFVKKYKEILIIITAALFLFTQFSWLMQFSSAATNDVVVTPSDMATSFGDVIADPSSWFFFNDETNTIDSSLGSFIAGPGTPPSGSDSVQISVSGTQRRNLATYQFSGTKVSDITELKFSTYNPSAGNGGSSDRSAYLNFNVTFDGLDTWQKRLVFVPNQNGSVSQNSWQEWDALDGGNSLWWWSGYASNGNKWPDNNTSEYRTISDLLVSFPELAVRTTDSWLGLRVGEPYADGYTENLDKFVFGTSSGTTVFDFDTEEEFVLDGKIWICHANNAANNRYTANNVSVNGLNGHGDHDGPFAATEEQAAQMKKDKIDWGDVIPPHEDYPGLNWEEGEAYWREICDKRGEVLGDCDEQVLSRTQQIDEDCVEPCEVGNELFMIGDDESDQLHHPADEFSGSGNAGDFDDPYADPFVVGVNTYEEFPWNSNFIQGYGTDFEVEFNYAGPDIPAAELTVSWSPGKSALENKIVYLDGNVVANFSRTGTSVAGWYNNSQVYQDLVQFPLTAGDHTLRFVHTTGDGTFWDYLKLTQADCGEQEPEVLTSAVTVCKLDDNQIELSGWTLMLLGDKVEDVVVPVSDPAGIDTTTSLNTDASYVAIAEGTWENRRNPLNLVDAEYSTEDNWVTQMDGFTGFSTDILELQINSGFGSSWGAYNSAHKYAQSFVMSADGTANFRIYDGDPVPTVNPSWYGDNFGSLSVAVYEGYAGITGENGCVTFEDVPYGEYKADEVMQDDWENLSGLGDVEVDSEEETFTVVNRIITDEPEVLACSVEVFSDGTNWVNDYGNANAKVLSWNHPGWTASVPGASWIWSDDPVLDANNETIRTFTKTFNWSGTLGTAMISIAADNDYELWVNGSPAGSGSNTFAGAANHDITSFVQNGSNTITIEVTNWAWPTVDAQVNPAGLKYKVAVEGTSQSRDCGGPTNQNGQLSGLVFEDVDGDKTQEPGENPLQGWTVGLFTHNSPYTYVSSTTTDVGGNYIFQNLALSGEYFVCQDLFGEWFQTLLNDAGYNGVPIESLAYGSVLDGPEYDDLFSEFCHEIVLTNENPSSDNNDFGNRIVPEKEVPVDDPQGSPGVLGTSTTGGQGQGEVLAESDTLSDTGNPAITSVIVGAVLAISAGALLYFSRKKSY